MEGADEAETDRREAIERFLTEDSTACFNEGGTEGERILPCFRIEERTV